MPESNPVDPALVYLDETQHRRVVAAREAATLLRGPGNVLMGGKPAKWIPITLLADWILDGTPE